MVSFTQGRQLGPNDLSILVRDASGALVDPALINYSIFQISDSLPLKPTQAYEYDLLQPQSMAGGPTAPPEGTTLVGQPQQIPVRASQGAYWVNLTVPTVWRGIFRLVWNLQMFQGSPVDTVQETFSVQDVDPTNPGFEAPSVLIANLPSITSVGNATPAQIAKAVMYVRQLLSDTNPDRNYHFRPPTPGRVVAGYNTRVGYIWLDSTVIMMLDTAISMLNLYNPKTIYSWTLDTIPADWGRIAAMGAAGLCLTTEAARWGAEGVSYSLNGISLDLNKSESYRSLGDAYMAQFNQMAPLVTAVRPFSAGLRQNRWLLG